MKRCHGVCIRHKDDAYAHGWTTVNAASREAGDDLLWKFISNLVELYNSFDLREFRRHLNVWFQLKSHGDKHVPVNIMANVHLTALKKGFPNNAPFGATWYHTGVMLMCLVPRAFDWSEVSRKTKASVMHAFFELSRENVRLIFNCTSRDKSSRQAFKAVCRCIRTYFLTTDSGVFWRAHSEVLPVYYENWRTGTVDDPSEAEVLSNCPHANDSCHFLRSISKDATVPPVSGVEEVTVAAHDTVLREDVSQGPSVRSHDAVSPDDVSQVQSVHFPPVSGVEEVNAEVLSNCPHANDSCHFLRSISKDATVPPVSGVEEVTDAAHDTVMRGDVSQGPSNPSHDAGSPDDVSEVESVHSHFSQDVKPIVENVLVGGDLWSVLGDSEVSISEPHSRVDFVESVFSKELPVEISSETYAESLKRLAAEKSGEPYVSQTVQLPPYVMPAGLRHLETENVISCFFESGLNALQNSGLDGFVEGNIDMLIP
jgi:hypothetical protein